VHPKDANSMAASRLSCRKPLVGTEWPISLLCTNGVRKLVFWKCRASISESKAPFSLWGNHWHRAMTIESSLESGCGLSHDCAQDGYNGTCVKIDASRPA